MNIKYCSFSVLCDVRKNYRNIARNMMEMLKLLLASSNFDRNRIKNIIEQLKQMKEKISTCDDSIRVLLEEDDFIQDILESRALFVDIDKSVIQSESLVNIYSDEIVETKFNGDPAEWFRFWESFENEIHLREDLSSQFKLICLKHHLESWPLDMVTKLGTSDSAYDEALKLLQDRFSNKSVLIESHLNALLDLRPPILTPISLMKFSSDFEYHMRALETYETDIEEASFFVVAILNKKLPSEIWDIINKDKEEYWTFTEFQNSLNLEIESLYLEFAEKSNATSSDENMNSPTRNNSEATNFPKFCHLCLQRHDIEDCPIYKTQSEKMKRAKQLRLCLICFAIDHMTDNCESPGCIFCKEQHNSVICVNQEVIICQLCKGSHRLADCNIFSSKAMKLERALRLKLCIKCFDDDHPSEKCVKFPDCKACGASHNSLFCTRAKANKKERKRDRERKIYNKMPCPLCSLPHDIQACTVYTSYKKKRDRAKELKLCLLCLKSDHPTDECTKDKLCKICQERHTTLLCPKMVMHIKLNNRKRKIASIRHKYSANGGFFN